jgi:mannose-6-phosphate isomerase-like protein (cupin superfamily)
MALRWLGKRAVIAALSQFSSGTPPPALVLKPQGKPLKGVLGMKRLPKGQPASAEVGIGVSSDDINSRSASIDRAALLSIASRTSWGEESHIRVGAANSGGQLTILDYRAPAGFGPPQHLHHREDEVFEVIEGQAVIWTPDLSFVLGSGDLVLLPKLGPHTWRAYGPKGVRSTATFTPSGFERFFQDIERRLPSRH